MRLVTKAVIRQKCRVLNLYLDCREALNLVFLANRPVALIITINSCDCSNALYAWFSGFVIHHYGMPVMLPV